MQRNSGSRFGKEPLSLVRAGEFVDDRLHVFKQRRIHFGQETLLIQTNNFAHVGDPGHATNWIDLITQNRIEIEQRSLCKNLGIPDIRHTSRSWRLPLAIFQIHAVAHA